MSNPVIKTMEGLIFWSRWLQAPLYLGLIAAQGVYVYQFMEELWHLVFGALKLSEREIMLIVLGLIDVVMIANLLVMVIVGGYETFVSRLHLDAHPDQPEWLSHVNAGVLKVKLGLALVGISSVEILRTFIEAANPINPMPDRVIFWRVVLHFTLILSAIAIAYTDKIMTSTLAMTRDTSH